MICLCQRYWNSQTTALTVKRFDYLLYFHPRCFCLLFSNFNQFGKHTRRSVLTVQRHQCCLSLCRRFVLYQNALAFLAQRKYFLLHKYRGLLFITLHNLSFIFHIFLKRNHARKCNFVSELATHQQNIFEKTNKTFLIILNNFVRF